MYPTATDVRALNGTTLVVLFENGVKKQFDVSSLFETYPYFTKLENRDLFTKVHVDWDGYALVWNSEIDLSSSAVWLKGTPVD